MLIDSHCHIPHKKYEKTVEGLISEAKEEGVTKIITIGTSLKENKRTLEVAEKFENVYSSIGIYPHDDRKKDIDTLRTELSKQIDSSPKVKAIGECGIDISNWDGGRPVEEQIDLFIMQIELALEKNLPIVIHNRNGDDFVLTILKEYKNTSLTCLVHCFVSSWEFAQNVLDLGHYISFTGIVTYNSGESIHETVSKVPADRFMVETDAPYLSPIPYRNMTNEPKNVKITAAKVAQLRGQEFAQVCEQTYKNTCKFFNL